MIVIETEGAYTILDKVKDTCTKIIKPYWLKKCPWVISNEVKALKKLEDPFSIKDGHFPQLISYDENSITTDYCGKVVSPVNRATHVKDSREFTNIPEDFEKQVNEILNQLEEAKLRHSDINAGHFLIKDGIVKLIDFEMCLEFGESEPKNYPQTMGIEGKTRNIDEPIDDRLMAKRTIQYISGGIQKIYDMIGKLPNRLQYHELPFNLMQKSDRKFLRERVEVLESVYDFKGKKGLDLGCNIGGITFALAIKGSEMTGVDAVTELIEIANACEEYYNLGCEFVKSEITEYLLKNINHYDFCTFLATWHWILKNFGIKKATDTLKKISETCEVMFIEVNFGHEEGLVGSEETMVEAGLTNETKLIDYIIKNTNYKNINVIGKSIGWNNRSCLMCSK